MAVSYGSFYAFMRLAGHRWIRSTRPLEATLVVWLPIFLLYAAATLPIPLLHGLAVASGFSGWVTDHREWWEVLLALTFRIILGGWTAIRFTHLVERFRRRP
jgi:hypothetical protein